MSRKIAPWMPKKEKGEVFEIGCVSGHGKTKTEARENAIELASEVLNRNYNPQLVTLLGKTAIIVQFPHGWMWTELQTPQPETPIYNMVMGSWHSVASHRELETIYGEILKHFAQQTFDGSDTSCPFDAERFKTDAEDYATWCKWQIRHAKAKASGLFDSNELHHIAGNFYHMFNFSTEQKAVIDSL